MIGTQPKLSIVRQCRLVGLSRSTAYYEPTPVREADLKLMRLLDEAHLQCPWYGSRSLVKWLRVRQVYVNRKRVQRLMRVVGMRSSAPQPRTSKPRKEHPVYPYLLRGLSIDRPNQVWAADITYIPMPRGFLYLVAIMDWSSRKVLSWRLSNTMDAGFCIEALQEAIALYGAPEIFNTDQGSQFTSTDFIETLKDAGVRISMDGKGRWLDNVFVERLWRSLKYEEVYLNAYDHVPEADRRIAKYFAYYNVERFHSSLNDWTPNQVYYADLAAAA